MYAEASSSWLRICAGVYGSGPHVVSIRRTRCSPSVAGDAVPADARTAAATRMRNLGTAPNTPERRARFQAQ
jgi:hypothetical protein